MRLVVTFLVAILAVTILVTPMTAQAQFTDFRGMSETGYNSLWVDYATFESDDSGKVRLEVYYKIFNYGLRFEADEGLFRAAYEVHIAVEDDDAIPLETYSTEKEVVVTDDSRTRSLSDFRSSQATFNIPPGKCRVNFVLQDANSESTYRHEFTVKAELPDSRHAQLSDIMFAQHVEPANEQETVFRKADMIVIPSVSKDYGGDEDSELIYYVEVYTPDNEQDRLVLESMIYAAGGKLLYHDTLSLEPNVHRHVQLKQVSVGELAPGTFTLEMTLRGRRNKKLDQKREEFRILWSQTAMLRNNYDEALRQLELIARAGEIKPMKQLETFEDRLIAFNQFWRERDRTPETPRNEAKIEFYRRIGFANERFRFLRQTGWSTDRGRIYVVYGEPDAIDDVPMSPGAPPYQIWHYYRGQKYLRFTFIDDDLDGDYRLQWPYDGTGMRPDF